MRRALALAFLAMALTACSEPLEFADWTIEVAEETAIRNVAPLPIDERTEVIELREVWSTGGHSSASEYMFYAASDLDVDQDGRLYVLDAGNHRVQVFDEDGTYINTIGGGEGWGPGMLSRGGRIVTTPGRVIVIQGFGRLDIWDREGEFLRQRRASVSTNLHPMAGLSEGTLVTRHAGVSDDGGRPFVFSKFSLDGEQVVLYGSVKRPPPVWLVRSGIAANSGLPNTRPRVVATVGGDVYIVRGDEYQVLALDTDGDARWALRAAWERSGVTEGDIADAVAYMRESIPDAMQWELDWPDRHPALSHSHASGWGLPIQVDGHGHLYVFPFVREEWSSSLRPADVYSRDGELLFSGLVDYRNWRTAKGDYVYGLDLSTESEEQQATKYRLIEPF